MIMYGVHRLFHYGVLYDRFHSVHHLPQKPPSALTLFVMSPFEAAGFGLVVMVLMWTWPVSLPAVAIFFTYNLVVGTAAHLPRRNSDEAPRWWDRHLGGSVAHLAHHEDPNIHFGFFTQYPDRLFGTTRPAET